MHMHMHMYRHRRSNANAERVADAIIVACMVRN